MYASIRRYQTGAAGEVNRLVAAGFVPQIKRAPGFVAYYGVDAGHGTWASVSVFETREQAEASNNMAAEWVRNNVASLVPGPPDITAGDVIAHASGSGVRV
jgi:hypothetical protein